MGTTAKNIGIDPATLYIAFVARLRVPDRTVQFTMGHGVQTIAV